jgi:hypothetical protein
MGGRELEELVIHVHRVCSYRTRGSFPKYVALGQRMKPASAAEVLPRGGAPDAEWFFGRREGPEQSRPRAEPEAAWQGRESRAIRRNDGSKESKPRAEPESVRPRAGSVPHASWLLGRSDRSKESRPRAELESAWAQRSSRKAGARSGAAALGRAPERAAGPGRGAL